MIENAEEAVYEEKKMEEMEVVFLMDRFGYMKMIDKSAYERNKEASHNENKYVLRCHEHGQDLHFYRQRQDASDQSGRYLRLVRFRDKGTPVDNLSNYDSAEEQMLYVAAAWTDAVNRI